MGEYNKEQTEEQTVYLEELVEVPDQWELSTESLEEEQEAEPKKAGKSQRYNLRPNRQTNFKAYLREGLRDIFDGYEKARQTIMVRSNP